MLQLVQSKVPPTLKVASKTSAIDLTRQLVHLSSLDPNLATAIINVVREDEAAMGKRRVDQPPEAEKRYGSLWARQVELANIRPPAVPAGLIQSLEEYYAACGAIGTLAAQRETPDIPDAVDFCLDFGEALAQAARKRWRKKA